MNPACAPASWRPAAAWIICGFIAAVNLLAIYLPWLEAVCAAALVFGRRFRRGELLGVGAMLLLFIGAMGINLYRGINLTCGCFSVSGGESMSWLNIARNIGLLLLAAIAWRWTPAEKF